MLSISYTNHICSLGSCIWQLDISEGPLYTTLSNELFQVDNMGANLAGKIPCLSSNLASSTLVKGIAGAASFIIKLAAPAYSKFPHILVSCLIFSYLCEIVSNNQHLSPGSNN